MKINREILYEALLLIAAALLLGFAYTFITKKGYFYEKKPSPSMEIISLIQTKELFASKNALFIDSRHEFEYNEGHIQGAINISLNEFATHIAHLTSIPKDRLLIIYCDGSQCNSSIELTLKLMELGYTNIKIFFGGWQEWKNNKLPVDK
jgi:rhodanese-related sulfurtransferase